MNPVKDVWRMVTVPLKAVFVVGLCGLINSMTFNGTWWVKWVALGMGIATFVAVGKGLRSLLLLALIAWAGRAVYRKYGADVRGRFDDWVSRTNPQWAQWRDVVGAVSSGAPTAPQPVRH